MVAAAGVGRASCEQCCSSPRWLLALEMNELTIFDLCLSYTCARVCMDTSKSDRAPYKLRLRMHILSSSHRADILPAARPGGAGTRMSRRR